MVVGETVDAGGEVVLELVEVVDVFAGAVVVGARLVVNSVVEEADVEDVDVVAHAENATPDGRNV